MERCPICKARLKTDNMLCPRCQTNLAIPMQVELQVQHLYVQSIIQFSEGHLEMAKKMVTEAVRLKRDKFSLALFGFIHSS